MHATSFVLTCTHCCGLLSVINDTDSIFPKHGSSISITMVYHMDYVCSAVVKWILFFFGRDKGEDSLMRI